MDAILLGSRVLGLLAELGGLLVSATVFSVATGVGAYVKGRVAGRWMLAGFFLGPLAFLALLCSSDL